MVLSTLLQRVCLAIKHTILDHAHPLPDGITVSLDDPTSVHGAMVLDVVRSTHLDCLSIVDGDHPPMIVVHQEGEEDVVCSEPFAACRYIARLWKLYPTNPTSVLVVESHLERLEAFVAARDDLRARLVAFVTDLETRQAAVEGPHIGGMTGRTLCDVAYQSVIQTCLDRLETTFEALFDAEGHPSVRAWWDEMTVISLDDAPPPTDSKKEE